MAQQPDRDYRIGHAIEQAKEEGIRAKVEKLGIAAKAVWAERLRYAVQWLSIHHPDKTFGTAPTIYRVHNDGLADFENYGERGNAVLLTSEFGELWWCAPVEPPDRQIFVLGQKKDDLDLLYWGDSGLLFEIRYHRASQPLANHGCAFRNLMAPLAGPQHLLANVTLVQELNVTPLVMNPGQQQLCKREGGGGV